MYMYTQAELKVSRLTKKDNINYTSKNFILMYFNPLLYLIMSLPMWIRNVLSCQKGFSLIDAYIIAFDTYRKLDCDGKSGFSTSLLTDLSRYELVWYFWKNRQILLLRSFLFIKNTFIERIKHLRVNIYLTIRLHIIYVKFFSSNYICESDVLKLTRKDMGWKSRGTYS